MALTLTTKSGKESPGIVAFQRMYVDYLNGDVITALMLSQLYYWYRPDENGKSKLRVFKDGMWWIAKSMADWQKELGLTYDQTRRSLRVLEERGLITTEVRTFNRAPTNHTRLIALKGTREVIKDPKQALIWDFQTPHLGSAPHVILEKPKSITETTEEKTTAEIASQNDSPIDLEKETEDMATLNDILKKKAEEKSDLKSGMEVEWAKRMSGMYGGFQPSMTMKEKGQLKTFRLDAEKCGYKGTEVLRWSIENWVSTASEVCSRVGTANMPSMPHVGWVCMHSSHIVDIYRQAHEVAPVVQSIAKVAEKVVEQVVPVIKAKEEDGPSQEDIAALFATLEAGAKAGG